MKLSGLLGFFGITACSHQMPVPGPLGGDARAELTGRVEAGQELAVLFVGNSYSYGVPRAFSHIAAEHGKPVRTGHSTYGGWSLQRHAQNEATLRKIREGGWDVVVIQEQSEIPALSPRKRAASMVPPLRKLVSEIRGAGAIPVLYQTWGRRDGNAKLRRDDFRAMNARVRSGYQASAREAGGLLVVPVGDAWEKEVAAGRGDRLFLEDGSHPTSAGNLLTAEVFFETFFGK